MLWIAIHLPLLSLESWAATLPFALQAPLALMGTQRVLSVNAAAQALGVRPGLKRATALALAPDLLLGRIDEARDAQALMRVAHAALAFTPMVSIGPHPAHTVLLEVQSSLRCFGGAAALLQRLRAAVERPPPHHHRLHIASAPTPQGAALLAQWASLAGDEPPANALAGTGTLDGRFANLGRWRQRLDAAPLALLATAAGHETALQGMGLHTLGALRRLPRAGLARRFGEALLDEIDRILGVCPDPRLPLALPEVFSAQLELWTRADTTDQILPAAAVLLEQLVAWARARQGRVGRFALSLRHEGRRARGDLVREAPCEGLANTTEVAISLAQPSSDMAHLHALLREHLSRLQLPAPTLELRLHCADWVASAPPNESLFPTPRSESEGLVQLIERLQARLGSGQVRRLVAVADHRPECASRSLPAPATLGRADAAIGRGALHGAPAAPRPVWLLNPPQALRERLDRPWLDGQPLQLLCGPERIETGWWDGLPAERDYFIARQGSGALVWVYRLRHARIPEGAAGEAAPGWFLQGRFG